MRSEESYACSLFMCVLQILDTLYYLRDKEVCFRWRWFVCHSVCLLATFQKVMNGLWWNFMQGSGWWIFRVVWITILTLHIRNLGNKGVTSYLGQEGLHSLSALIVNWFVSVKQHFMTTVNWAIPLEFVDLYCSRNCLAPIQHKKWHFMMSIISVIWLECVGWSNWQNCMHGDGRNCDVVCYYISKLDAKCSGRNQLNGNLKCITVLLLE